MICDFTKVGHGKRSHLWNTGNSLSSQTQLLQLQLTNFTWKHPSQGNPLKKLNLELLLFVLFNFLYLRMKQGTVSSSSIVFSHVLQTPWCKGPSPSESRARQNTSVSTQKPSVFKKAQFMPKIIALKINVWLVRIYKTWIHWWWCRILANLGPVLTPALQVPFCRYDNTDFLIQIHFMLYGRQLFLWTTM